jgi:hypothetical protein
MVLIDGLLAMVDLIRIWFPAKKKKMVGAGALE